MADINEIWKDISINTNYEVSNLGRVRSKDRLVPCKNGKFRHKKIHYLTPYDHHGYYHVGFNVNGKLVNPLLHRLVIEAFMGKKEYPKWEVDHINGDTHDNRLENLEYVSSSENTKRAYNLGLQDRKVLSLANRRRVATPEQILYIRQQFKAEGRTLPSKKNKDFYERMAEKFGFKNPQYVYKIVLGITNKFINEDIVQTTNRNGSENYSGKDESNKL